MGRTNRRRRRKSKEEQEYTLNHCQNIITLRQWMSKNKWINSSQLFLKNFFHTGRGVFSKIKINAHDTIIEIPYTLMITYTTLNSSDLVNILSNSNYKLEIQDMLSLFLAIEKHKKDKSTWKIYINSLPVEIPMLPLMHSEETINVLPTNVKELMEKSRNRFMSSWDRVSESLNVWLCKCCNKLSDCVITKQLYAWAYVMVNTRAVYTNPTVVRNITGQLVSNLDSHLSDEPSMALCPFLDMFNHSNNTITEAVLEQNMDSWTYSLKSLTPYEKYNQIFINYGCHDNVKLWNEYGFYIPENQIDDISFSLNNILKSTQLSANKTQIKFIKEHAFDEHASVNLKGMSYNLKAVLYVLLNCDRAKWNEVIFSDKYNQSDLKNMYSLCNCLLENLSNEYVQDLNVLNDLILKQYEIVDVYNFWRDRIKFIRLIKETCKLNVELGE